MFRIWHTRVGVFRSTRRPDDRSGAREQPDKQWVSARSDCADDVGADERDSGAFIEPVKIMVASSSFDSRLHSRGW